MSLYNNTNSLHFQRNPLTKNTIFFIFAFLLFSAFQNLSAQEESDFENVDEQSTKLRANIKAFYMPVFSIRPPKDKAIFYKNQLTTDIKNGYGYGLYLGLDIVDKFDSETFSFGFGFILQETKHDSDLNLYQLKTNSLLFEVNLFHTFYRSEKLDIIQQFGIGGGGVLFNYDKDREDFYSGMGSFRYIMNFEFYGRWCADIGGGLFLWGQPSETLGYGGFFTISIGCRF